MTPDERTTVLQAVIRTKQGPESNHVPGKIPICPSSWYEQTEALRANISARWTRLSLEEQLGIWLAAPDSDYEFVVHQTEVMQKDTP